MIEELYRLCRTELVHWCELLTQDQSAAEDLVQETFFRAMQHQDELEDMPEGQQKAWLRRVARNLFVDQVRHRKFESAAEYLPEEQEEDAGFDGYSNEELLQKLPEEEQKLFRMRYLQGYNSKELGELFSMPPGTVRARLSAARKKLRQELEH